MGSIAVNYQNRHYDVQFPHKCPLCHAIVILQNAYANALHDATFPLCFVCPNPECGRLFIAYYDLGENVIPQPTRFSPNEPGPDGFPQLIRDLSPSFTEIYREASRAHADGL